MAGCVVTPQWTQKMALLPGKVQTVCLVGMEDGMELVANIARRTARWNPDGADTGRWLVTGTARESIMGYAVGKPPGWPGFNVTDPIYGSEHRAPDGDGTNLLQFNVGHITGALTMVEQHSADLQRFERTGTTSGLSPLTAGENITVEAVRNNEQLIWNSIKGAVKTLV